MIGASAPARRLSLWLVCFYFFVSGIPAIHSQMTSNSGRYHVQPNDSLSVHYRYTPQYNETVKIQPDGHATLNLVGDLSLAGLTVEQATSLITSKASLKLREPEIEVELASFENPHFVVAGQVEKPGSYDLSGAQTSVLEAIAQAGGFKNSARNTQIIVYHRTGDDLTLQYVTDAKRVMEYARKESFSMPVHSGDLVIVPQNKFSSVERVLKIFNLGVYYPLPQ